MDVLQHVMKQVMHKGKLFTICNRTTIYIIIRVLLQYRYSTHPNPVACDVPASRNYNMADETARVMLKLIDLYAT
jgi:hypothetical protein